MRNMDYKSENCAINFLSDLAGEDAEKMIGKTVAKVDAERNWLCIMFTDGSSITCSGDMWVGKISAEYRNA